MKRLLFTCAALLLGAVVAACGTVATPEWLPTLEAEADTTAIAQRATAAYETENAPTATPTTTPTPTITPTNTPEPTATPTDVPPTEVPPTEAPTEEVVAADAGDTEDAADIEAGDTADEVPAADDDPITALVNSVDLAAGEAIFNMSYETSSGVWQCGNCHSVDESQARLIGPGLWGLYERADARAADSGDVDGLTYVINSIYNSNDYIVPDDGSGAYPPGLMPQNYAELIVDEDFDNLVGYILSLGNPNVGAEVASADAPTDEMDEPEATVADTGDDPVAMLIADGDPAAGEAIFNMSYETASGVWLCSNCHTVDETQARLIGPGLWGLHGRVDDRAADSGDPDGITYVVNSIYNPNDYIVPDDGTGAYPPGLMPQNYQDLFTEEEFNNLMAYLFTLGNENSAG